MSSLHKTCEACAAERAVGNLDAALAWRECDGKGIVRTRESWVCNGCGGCLCPDTDPSDPNGAIPHGLMEAKVSGGYSSPCLSDMTTYVFSLCEACLRTMFGGFKIGPSMGGYAPGIGEHEGDGESYETEVAERDAYEKKCAEERATYDKLIAERRCTDRGHRDDNHVDHYCGEPAALFVEDDRGLIPRCVKHGRDGYALGHLTVHVNGRTLTPADKAAIGKKYLKALREGRFLEENLEHEVALSTLFPLLLEPEISDMVRAELYHLSGELPPRVEQWESARIPLSFSTSHATEAAAANDWLAWGRRQGYVNAVAHACLGYTAERMWKLEGEDLDADE